MLNTEAFDLSQCRMPIGAAQALARMLCTNGDMFAHSATRLTAGGLLALLPTGGTR